MLDCFINSGLFVSDYPAKAMDYTLKDFKKAKIENYYFLNSEHF